MQTVMLRSENALRFSDRNLTRELQPHWYALYTCANHEKRVVAELDIRSVEHFLPLYNSVRQGLDGILLKKKTRCRFALSLDLIQRSIAAEVDAADVELFESIGYFWLDSNLYPGYSFHGNV